MSNLRFFKYVFMIFTRPDNCSAKYSCLFAISDLKKPHKCTNLHDFGKFNINHINLILLVSLQINAVYLYVPANERIIQTNANIYTVVIDRNTKDGWQPSDLSMELIGSLK